MSVDRYSVCVSFIAAILYICFANALFFLRQKFECQFPSPTSKPVDVARVPA